MADLPDRVRLLAARLRHAYYDLAIVKDELAELGYDSPEKLINLVERISNDESNHTPHS